MVNAHSMAFADSSSDSPIREISLQAAYDLALKDPVNLRLLVSQIGAIEKQENYLNWQQDKLNNTDTGFTPSNLPTSFDYFMNLVPNYDELSPEEQVEFKQVANMQILINNSLNQLLDGLSTQRQLELEKELDNQRKILSRNLRTLDSDHGKVALELSKIRETVKYYVAQKYIHLLTLENDLNYLSLENEYKKKQLEDEQTLYQYGVASQKTLEELKYAADKQNIDLDQKNKEYEYYLDELKLELGMPLSQDIRLLPVDIPLIELQPLNVSDLVNKNYELLQSDQDVQLASKNYDAANSAESDTERQYLHAVWEVSIQKRNLLEQQLEQKTRAYGSEEKAILSQIHMQELNYNKLLQQKEDNQTRYRYGLITVKELEKSEIDLQKANQLLENAKLSYALFIAKLDLAKKGVIL
jgi:outer membrane protein TolC